MKKVLQSILTGVLMTSLCACGAKNTEVPDSVVERHVMGFERILSYEQEEGYQGSEFAILEHEVNEKDHTDEVTASVVQNFPYGHYEHTIHNIFEYNRASDLWNRIDKEDNILTEVVMDMDKDDLLGEYGSSAFSSTVKIIDINDTSVVVEGEIPALIMGQVDITGTYPLKQTFHPHDCVLQAQLTKYYSLCFSPINGVYFRQITALPTYKLNTPIDFDFDLAEAAEEQTGIFSTNTNFIGNEKMIRYWIENDYVMMYDGAYQNLYEEEAGAIGHLTVKSGCLQEIYSKTSASAQKIGEVYDLTPLAYYETVNKNGCNWYRIDKDKAIWINDANNGINLK